MKWRILIGSALLVLAGVTVLLIRTPPSNTVGPPASNTAQNHSMSKTIRILHARNNPGVPQRKDLSCPRGYHLIKDLFTESNGSHQDGYVEAPATVREGDRIELSGDYLLAGEWCAFPLILKYEREHGQRV